MAGSSKPGKKTKVVVLTLSPQTLAQFPSDESPISSSDVKELEHNTSPTIQPDAALEDQSESNATPAPLNGDSVAQTQDDRKKKTNVSGRKRAPPAIDPDAPARERARPGPKKKQRLTDVNADQADATKPTAAVNAANASAAHKLGPKANTGAINAGLRALDRSGKPCRRWEKKGLQLKSFTGATWSMSSWKGSRRAGLNADGEVQSDSSSEVKLDPSGIASEKSASGEAMDITMDNDMASSPAPLIAGF